MEHATQRVASVTSTSSATSIAPAISLIPATSRISRTDVSEANRSRILWHLYRHGVSSRAQIAKALHLTPAAITKITAKLIDAGIVVETGEIKGSKRRRSIGLAINASRFHFIGVKFARSLVQIGVFDLAGNRVSLVDLPTVDDSTVNEAVTAIHQNVDQLLAHDPNVVSIGMAVPGPYLRETGRAALVSSMPHWRNINFIEEFAQRSPVPLFIEQDARAGALAQRLFGEPNGTGSLAYYLLGEGIGLGVIDGGELVYGNLGAATELGHVSIDINGRPCECGNVGCLERYCSAGAIHDEIDKRGIVAGSKTMTHREACARLFQASQQGDKAARELVREVGRYAGYGCVTVCNTFNPSRIVIGDIGAMGGDILLEAIREVVRQRVIPEIADTTDISLSALPTDATVLGAAAAAITRFLDHPMRFLGDTTNHADQKTPKSA
ncbi:ROK family transcriptional regulator [Bifidobacterium sp. ESL0790]|uniref:ROK family transcriptional regulator n=1 Tax=Bifidobacterium sp. ESL0790 TaxID=2983233 RepID=UPI0023F831F5|nr:ROK family transcriptional regulator [Bifidobacterium sp. ESL0790]WEV72870.1 ROK family transcriptional regulator [Bifidobacterium sp. ESL0790]